MRTVSHAVTSRLLFGALLGGLALGPLTGCSNAPASAAQLLAPTTVAGARAPLAPKVSAEAQRKLTAAVKALPGSKASQSCSSYDYFPGGGLRSFYCHVRDNLDIAKIAKLAGMKIFLKGPHMRGALTLDAKKAFAHYNPRFVRWLAAAIPGASSSKVRKALQPAYDKAIKPLARVFWVSGRKLFAHPGFLNKEKKRYLGLVAAGKTSGYYEPFFFFMNPRFIKTTRRSFNAFYKRGFDGGVSGNVTKTCVAFWIRRSIDGTARAFFDGLTELLRTYDKRFLRAAKNVKPGGDHKALMKI